MAARWRKAGSVADWIELHLPRDSKSFAGCDLQCSMSNGVFMLSVLLLTMKQEFLLESLQKLATITEDLATAKNDVSNHDSVRARKGLTPPESNTDGKASDSSLQSPSLDTTVGSFDRNKLVEMEGLIAQAKQLVGNIQVCAEHQALITNNVLDLSRLDAGKMEPSFDVVDIQTLGQETVGMMCSKAQRKHITLSLDPSKSRPLYLKTDATILRQILLNLVSNAIKVGAASYKCHYGLTLKLQLVHT